MGIRGKVGLALSGGGFRASLYHIGVLAKLAEPDLLRHVEYLSCVSGGSIIGAHFYLEVRKLLCRTRPDSRDPRVTTISPSCSAPPNGFLAGVERTASAYPPPPPVAHQHQDDVRSARLLSHQARRRAVRDRVIFSKVEDGEGARRERWLNEGPRSSRKASPRAFRTQGWQLAPLGEGAHPDAQRHLAQHRPQLAVHRDLDGRARPPASTPRSMPTTA